MVVALSGMNLRCISMAMDIEPFIDKFFVLADERITMLFIGRGLF
jgi:hypothetical protein